MEKPAGKRIAILGEMLELGAESERSHAHITAMTQGLNEVITVGEGFAAAAGNYAHYDQVADIDLEQWMTTVQPGDIILVKGSNKVFWASDFVSQLTAALGARR